MLAANSLLALIARPIFERNSSPGELRASDRPDTVTPRDWLHQPESDAPWRFEVLQRVDPRVMLAAQRTVRRAAPVGELTGPLADAFVSRAAPRAAHRKQRCADRHRNAPRRLWQWLAREGIRQSDRVMVARLRRQARSFNVHDPQLTPAAEDRRRW